MDPNRWPHVGQTYGLDEHSFLPGLGLPPGGLPAPAPSLSSLSPLGAAGMPAHMQQPAVEHMPPLSVGTIAATNPYKSVIVGQPAYSLEDSPSRLHLGQQTEQSRSWGLSNFLPSADRQELPRSTAELQRSQAVPHISHGDMGYIQQSASAPKTDVGFMRQVPQSLAQGFSKAEGRFTDHISVSAGFSVNQQTRVYPQAQPKPTERGNDPFSRSFEESNRNVNFDPHFNPSKTHDSPQHHCSPVPVSQQVHPEIAHPIYQSAPAMSPTKISKEYYSPPRKKEELMNNVNFQPYQDPNSHHPSLNTLAQAAHQADQEYRMQQAAQQDAAEQKPFEMGVHGPGRTGAKQAAADSTTTPKKGRRKRKSKEAKPVVLDTEPAAEQMDIDASYRLVQEANAMLNEPITDTTSFGSMLQELSSPTVNTEAFEPTSPSTVERGRIYGGGPVHKTKAEQKQMPAPSPAEEEDEFAAFASPPDPKIKAESVDCKKEPLKGDDKNFQVSYLQFIQGKKQETLTSVTNTTITEKPVMPKYVPEPPRASKHQIKQEEIVKKSEFSDDEDSTIHEANIDEAVQNIISNLESTDHLKSEKADLEVPLSSKTEASKKKTTPENSKTKSSPENSNHKISMSDTLQQDEKSVDSSDVSEMGAKPSTGRAKGRNTAKRGRSRGRGVKRTSEDDDVHNEVDSPALSSEVEELPVRRSTPRRAAKTIGQEKLQKGNPKKKQTKKTVGRKKRKLTDISSDTDQGTSDAEFAPPSSESESADEADSDNDPVWTPFEQKSTPLSAKVDSEDEMMDDTSKRGRKRMPVRGRARGRGRPAEFKSVESPIPYATTPASSTPEDGVSSNTATSKPTNTVRPIVISVEEPEEDSDGEIPAHKYIKGEFVIDKKDTENVDSFPLWKIYSTSLIQKFEPIQHNDRLCHKVTMLYANWNTKYKKKYNAVKVKYHNHARNQDVVEVLPEYMPRPPFDPKLEEHEMMIPFNILIQTLVSQSLEEGFLKIVMDTKDSYYIDAFEKIEDKLKEAKEKLQNPTKFIRTFEAAMQKYPKLEEEITIGQMQGCKALQSTNERATRLIKLSGPDYDRDTLVVKDREGAQFQEYMVSMKAAQLSKVYHHLHHYRLQLLETCKKKVTRHREKDSELESKGILDKCLQDRVWIQKLFWQMNYLLREAGVIVIPS